VYDEPRALLKAIPGMELVEMVRNHENAWCCGSGAGVEEAFPELALWTTGERLREAVKAGVQAIVSACPGCEGIFSTYIRSNTLNIKVLDIAEILATACGCQKHLGVS
jgi:Fe-S oxidoreductase